MSTHADYTEKNLKADNSRYARLDHVLDEIDIKSGNILDIACGPGVQFRKHLKTNTFVGIDISEEALKMAENNGYKTLAWDLTVLPLPFKDEEFDVVILSDILEHLIQPLELLNEARRVLKDDGHVILSLPNHFYLDNRIRILKGKGLVLPFENHQRYEDYNYFHIRFFRTESISSLLEKTDLKIVKDMSNTFLAILPKFMSWPLISKIFGKIRHLTLKKWADLWVLHFVLILKKK